jgi:hypothetical protein
MHKKIPSVCDERPSDKSSPGYQIGHGETNPDLPKDCEDRLVGVGMMQPVLGWRKAMQHKAVNKIFGKSPPDHATNKKRSASTHSKMRNCQQDDGEQGRYQYFAEIDDGCHESSLTLDRLQRNAPSIAAGVSRRPEYRLVPTFLPYARELTRAEIPLSA